MSQPGFRPQSNSHNSELAQTLLPATAMLIAQWKMVKDDLMRDVGGEGAQSWISTLKVMGLIDDTVVMATNTDFAKEWIETHYLELIIKHWRLHNSFIQKTRIICQAEETTHLQASISNETTSIKKAQAKAGDELESVIQDQGALDERFTFDNFVVGKPNELAYAAALRVAESKIPPFNPLFLYGGVGLGKTHLMHAIAWKIKQCHPKRRVIYMSAEKFMYLFVRSLRYKDMMSFKEQFRTVDILMIDDVQFISGKETTQEEFFHTFNALVDKNHQVIVSADKSPSDLENMEERLRSRLGWGLVADIHPTSYELRLGILQAKAELLGVHVPIEVIEFLAFKISSNVRELEGALNRIIAYTTLVGGAITLERTQDVLRDLLRSHDQRLTIDDIQRKVCEYFNIKIADIVSSKRLKNITRPRQVAMFLCKQLTPRSLPEIGKKFGGRDHTTVLHAVKKVQELCTQYEDFANDVDILKRALQSKR